MLIALFLAACTSPAETPTPTATENGEVATAAPTATPTEEPVAILNICTTSLPESAFPYDGKNPISKQNLLALIQRTAFPTDESGASAALLVETPTQDNGGITLKAVNAQLGEKIVDANGDLLVLKAGVTVRPSGCRSADCAVTWDGTEALSLDQMVVSFQLNEGLTWSDGAPLTAADSVFSFTLASDPGTPGLQWMESRTDSYTAEDNSTILWTGVPGFTTSEIEDLFWQPLPSHLFAADAGWESVSSDPSWSAVMASLGVYQVSAWTDDSIRLVWNEYYGGDKPQYGEITIQAIPVLEDALAAFSAGTCDVLDQSYHLEQDSEALATLQADPETALLVEQTASWLQLVIGITPASYDEYYNPLYGDRPDFFGDSRTREAIASCLDRQAIQEAVYAGLAELKPSFVSADETALASEDQLVRDPARAARLLEAVGWVDHDLNPETPLQAWYVGNIPTNTTFSINLYVDASSLSQQIAAIVQSSLGECGIEVTPVTLPASQLYAAGPDGVLFGRQFDLALIGWAPLTELDCALYESDQIPSQGNQWVGTNIAGWSEAYYDKACNAASLALPDERHGALDRAESQFTSSYPAVPLISVPAVVAVKNSACAAVSELWNFGADNSTCP